MYMRNQMPRTFDYSFFVYLATDQYSYLGGSSLEFLENVQSNKQLLVHNSIP